MKSEMKESAPIHSLERFPFIFCHIVATLGFSRFCCLLLVPMPLDSHKIRLDSDHVTNMRLSHMLGNNLPKSSGYGVLSVLLTMAKTLSLACGKATPQPPAAWRHLMLACLHDVSIKDSVMFYVSMWEQSTWTSWVHTKHWYPKHQKKLQKNQKTYRNLCKLPISANDNYLELAMISPSFSEKKHPEAVFLR